MRSLRLPTTGIRPQQRLGETTCAPQRDAADRPFRDEGPQVRQQLCRPVRGQRLGSSARSTTALTVVGIGFAGAAKPLITRDIMSTGRRLRSLERARWALIYLYSLSGSLHISSLIRNSPSSKDSSEKAGSRLVNKRKIMLPQTRVRPATISAMPSLERKKSLRRDRLRAVFIGTQVTVE